MAELTMVLHNYSRPEQMLKMIRALRRQKLAIEIFLWDNADVPFQYPSLVDWYIRSSRNAHVNSFFYMARQAVTPFVGRVDDDLMTGDDRVLRDGVQLLATLAPTQMIGAWGTELVPGKSYRDALHHRPEKLERSVTVDIVKGRLMLLHAAGLQACRDVYDHPHIDLTMSFDLAQGQRRRHIIPRLFRNRFIDLPEGEDTYSAKPEHYQKRDELSKAWLSSLNTCKESAGDDDRETDGSVEAATCAGVVDGGGTSVGDVSGVDGGLHAGEVPAGDLSRDE